MKIHCPKCGEHCEVDFEPTVGQHIICPFCGVKFSYGVTLEDVGHKESAEDQTRTVMAVCPYCGFAEPVEERYSGHLGTCSKCNRDFTIMPNARGVPFQPQYATSEQPEVQSATSTADGVLGFLLGLVLGIFGVLLAVLIDKKKYLKASLWGLVGNLVIGIIGAAILIGITAQTASSAGRPTISVDIGNAAEEEEALIEEEVKAFKKMSGDIRRKAAGAAKALSAGEGAKARSAADAISESSLRSLGE